MKSKKLYRIWLTRNDYVDVEAYCPSLALKEAKVFGIIRDIQIVKKKN